MPTKRAAAPCTARDTIRTMLKRLRSSLAVLSTGGAVSLPMMTAAAGGAARTPPLGFNTWCGTVWFVAAAGCWLLLAGHPLVTASASAEYDAEDVAREAHDLEFMLF